jgi:hypothetical protein
MSDLGSPSMSSSVHEEVGSSERPQDDPLNP